MPVALPETIDLLLRANSPTGETQTKFDIQACSINSEGVSFGRQ